MKRRRMIPRLLAALAAAALPTLAAATAATVEQPRAFGHVVGDVLTQRVLLEADGRDLAAAALPRAERVGAWFDRRTPRIETAADGRHWLVVEYQLINAPQTLRRIVIPAWRLTSRTGGTPLEVPEWPLAVAPLTPNKTFDGDGLQALRPDRPAPRVDTAVPARRLAIASTLLALTLAAWLGWVLWRHRRALARQPFARALHEMRRLDEAAPEAWRALHEAFDRTAGRVVQRASLPALFQRAPHLEPLRPAIEQFYVQSGERFFAAAEPREPLSVRALCRALCRIERRHER